MHYRANPLPSLKQMNCHKLSDIIMGYRFFGRKFCLYISDFYEKCERNAFFKISVQRFKSLIFMGFADSKKMGRRI